MTPRILQVVSLEQYQLMITYETNEIKIFDVKPYLTLGRFGELTNEPLFKTVRVIFDTVGWINGLDLDPDEMYVNSVPYDKKNKSTA